MIRHLIRWISFWSLTATLLVWADPRVDDPTQTIRYWADMRVAAEASPNSAWAHDIYSQLLRAWDYRRVAPNLNVIRLADRFWAASLADGNILITEATLEFIQQNFVNDADDLLAFVLAHELAHQRSDDLWHLKFYRMVGDQAPDVQAKVMDSLQMSDVSALERAEAQADQDAVVMMATVGFNPAPVLEADSGKDFYRVWVEHLWQQECATEQSANLALACAQAQVRALRTRAQLDAIVQQTLLYDLGVEALVAGNYPEARRYFMAFGRSFPNRVVLSAIGLSYLLEAQPLYQQLRQQQGQVPLYFPLYIEGRPLPNATAQLSRSQQADRLAFNRLLTQAQEYLQQAIKLAPNEAGPYWLLISSYQMADNGAMAQGLLDGQYRLRFGSDLAAAYFSAINQWLNKDVSAANRQLFALSEKTFSGLGPQEELRFAVFANLANSHKQLDQAELAQTVWQRFARLQRDQQRADLMQMSLAQLQGGTVRPGPAPAVPTLAGHRIGDRWQQSRPELSTTLWFDGTPLQGYQRDGLRIVTDDEFRILSVATETTLSEAKAPVQPGWALERVLARHGVPSRRLHWVEGDFLAFDASGLAVRLKQDRVVGWFLYTPGAGQE